MSNRSGVTTKPNRETDILNNQHEANSGRSPAGVPARQGLKTMHHINSLMPAEHACMVLVRPENARFCLLFVSSQCINNNYVIYDMLIIQSGSRFQKIPNFLILLS